MTSRPQLTEYLYKAIRLRDGTNMRGHPNQDNIQTCIIRRRNKIQLETASPRHPPWPPLPAHAQAATQSWQRLNATARFC